MGKIIRGKGLDRTDILTTLRAVSFSSQAANQGADDEVIRILPDVNVLKVGGQSMMDRGRAAIYPFVEELVENRQKHKMLVGVGGGTRARHAYAIALDLGMPTSVLAKLGMNVPMQNARMLQLLMAKHGGILIDHEAFAQLPLYYALNCIPIIPGMPPYGFWEKPAERGRIPENRTDSGVYLGAEALGARSCLFCKDEKGLFTANPKVDRDAKFIPRVHAGELLEMDLPDLIIEPVVLKNMLRARHMKEIQVFNALERGNLTRALNGEHVGTIIYVD
jgi:molybdenum storage protein